MTHPDKATIAQIIFVGMVLASFLFTVGSVGTWVWKLMF